MPFKFHEPRRHHIPRARYRVTNWSEYDRGLVGRGDLRLWIAKEALAAWAAPRRRTRGGQARFSDLAIEAVLMLANLFRLPLRQAEGFVRSLMALMSLRLPVPDHTTLARRRRTVPIAMNAPGRRASVDLVLDSTGLQFQGPGEWDRLKHGEKRRAWRKLHLAVDAGTGEILAFGLTDSDTADASMAGSPPEERKPDHAWPTIRAPAPVSGWFLHPPSRPSATPGSKTRPSSRWTRT